MSDGPTLFAKLSSSMNERAADAVARNCQAILNSRRGYAAVVDVFGLGDYGAFTEGRPLSRAYAQEMLRTIARFEPRLEKATLTSRGRPRGLWAEFVLTGSVLGAPQTYDILVHSVFREVVVRRAQALSSQGPAPAEPGPSRRSGAA